LALAFFAFLFGVGLFTFPITILMVVFWVRTVTAALPVHGWRTLWLTAGAPFLLFWPIFWLLVFTEHIHLDMS
jgi:hypothetical protein